MGSRRQTDRLSGSAHSRGFTVLELLTVVGVVAVLLAIAVPTYQRFTHLARSRTCTANLKNVGAALNLYLADNGLILPELVAARNSKDEPLPAIDTVLVDYTNDPIVFACPADDQQLFETTGTSYFWNSLVNGQPLGSLNLLGLTENHAGIPLVSDKEDFHQNVGHEVNILYADGHVQKELQFTVDP